VLLFSSWSSSFFVAFVFFIGDNGGSKEFGSLNTPLRGGKYDTYEGGVRVPFFVRWPAKLKPGLVYDRPVSATDAFVTALAAAGVAAPPAIDGVDILPHLRVDNKSDAHRYIVWNPGVAGMSKTSEGAVRGGPWKLVRAKPSGDWELYDVENDIAETKNVAAEHPEVVKALRAALDRWMQTGTP
jgi:arylsulfatase A-like enzyme